MKNLLELAESIGVTGFLHCDELQALVELAADKDVLEIGSYRGLSAWGMALTAHSLWCCDTFRACTNGQRQESSLQTLDAFLHAVSRYRNVRHFVGTSEQAHAQAQIRNDKNGSFAPHGQFDMIFIDAMHDRQSVRADLERWWPRVKDGGIMALHDFDHFDFPGVKLAADEFFGKELPHRVVTLAWIVK